jgi:hypothetical protein
LQDVRPDLIDDIRFLTPSGALISGVDVYLHVARAIWWARPFARFAGLPGNKSIAAWIYRRIATNRYCLSRGCRADPTE